MKTVGKSLLLCSLFLLFSVVGVLGGDFQEDSTSQNGFPVEEWEEMEEERLTGKDFVVLGELGEVEGILFYEDEEWFLETEEMVYEVHMGDPDYRDGIGLVLEEGEEASIKGYLYGDDIAVVSITVARGTYDLRTEQGHPLWGAFGGAMGEQQELRMERLERQEQLARILETQRIQEEIAEQVKEEQEEKSSDEKK